MKYKNKERKEKENLKQREIQMFSKHLYQILDEIFKDTYRSYEIFIKKMIEGQYQLNI